MLNKAGRNDKDRMDSRLHGNDGGRSGNDGIKKDSGQAGMTEKRQMKKHPGYTLGPVAQAALAGNSGILNCLLIIWICFCYILYLPIDIGNRMPSKLVGDFVQHRLTALAAGCG
jgi:hypothetical protein